MPQPLSKFKWSGLHIGNNVDAPSRHRPELALLAMQVLAEWSILEHWMGTVFVKMLGANPGPAAAMYASLTGAAAQKAAFRAVAEWSIKDETQADVFEAVLARFTSLAKERNRLAHWVWGHSPDILDGVILADPKSLLEDEVDREQTMQAFRSGEKVSLTNELKVDDILVYKRIDFERLSADVQKLMGQVMEFRFVLSDHPANRDGQLLQRLLDVPEILEVVNRLRQRRKNDREAQQQQPEKPPSTRPK
jgi:hypothetical protein